MREWWIGGFRVGDFIKSPRFDVQRQTPQSHGTNQIPIFLSKGKKLTIFFLGMQATQIAPIRHFFFRNLRSLKPRLT